MEVEVGRRRQSEEEESDANARYRGAKLESCEGKKASTGFGTTIRDGGSRQRETKATPATGGVFGKR